MYSFNEDTLIKFKGSQYTVKEFALKHFEGNMQMASKSVNMLVDRGEMFFVDTNTKQDKKEIKAVESAIKQETIDEQVNYYDKVKELETQDSLYKNNQLVYKGKRYCFIDYNKAKEFRDYAKQQFGIKVTIEEVSDFEYYVNCYQLTQSMVDNLDRMYTIDKITHKVSNQIERKLNDGARTVEMIGSKAVVPLVKATANATAKAGGALAKVGIKSVTGVLHSLIHESKEVYSDIKESEETKRLQQDIYSIRNTAKKNFNDKFGGSGSNVGEFIE